MKELRGHVSHIELASMNFDQFILTVALREYDNSQSVCGMVHVKFTAVIGFKMLDEGNFLSYPFPENCANYYCHKINKNGWWAQEKSSKNLSTVKANEYLIATQNECVCVLDSGEPLIIMA